MMKYMTNLGKPISEGAHCAHIFVLVKKERITNDDIQYALREADFQGIKPTIWSPRMSIYSVQKRHQIPFKLELCISTCIYSINSRTHICMCIIIVNVIKTMGKIFILRL